MTSKIRTLAAVTAVIVATSGTAMANPVVGGAQMFANKGSNAGRGRIVS